jgi:hypothetical protein
VGKKRKSTEGSEDNEEVAEPNSNLRFLRYLPVKVL